MGYLESDKKQELFANYGKSNTDTGSAESQIALFTLTEDAKEGPRAFKEKRTPNFIGR